ncbi:hypothetical protein CYLTODRAFT_443976 [Cylindrobasidium torrendii FP15055 ss-10]|uniref:Uncharacterized protein n=1 Tax=Cylindrobasidium torrendii FP15055 ss-10 TaxID=1314674 RepID=A0A0D7BB77_9AGAR|nr:hypothetical protein CYLTODRAFT_443976 [Cylindrobasidium torrendii FP15055 ss-10]
MAHDTKVATVDNALATPETSHDITAKKRKRPSPSLEDEDEVASKHSRTDERVSATPPPTSTKLKTAGEAPLPQNIATKVLEVLDVLDNQGLLDRVYTLGSDPSTSTSSSVYSLRTLLQNAPVHPLFTLRNAVKNLLPIASHPRTRPSSPASRQIHFCKTALSLLEQASFHSVELPLDQPSIFSSPADNDSSSLSNPPRKYALVQQLPQGDYWTSLNNDLPPSLADDFKDLPTGHAELVALFPDPAPLQTRPIPTLGSYHKTLMLKPAMPKKQQTRSAGSFLDYGACTSFAPIFEQECAEVGMAEMGFLCYDREIRKQRALEKRKRLLHASDSVMDVDVPESSRNAIDTTQPPTKLLSSEDVDALKGAMEDVALLSSIEELLERNQKALARLEVLQSQRLDKNLPVDKNSDEWQLAQSVLDSLTLLTALRPRKSDESDPTLTPSASALHVLQQTLPLQPTTGWYGTLPTDKPKAIRDNSTVKVQKGVAATPAPPTQPPTPIAPVTASSITAPSFASYNYSYGQGANQHYRPGTSGTATPTHVPPYRPYQQSTTGSAGAFFGQFSGQAQQQQQQQQQQQGAFFNYQNPQTYGAYQPYMQGYGQPASGTHTPTSATTYYQTAGMNTPTTQASRSPVVANTVKQAQWAPMQFAAPLRASQSTFSIQTPTR